MSWRDSPLGRWNVRTGNCISSSLQVASTPKGSCGVTIMGFVSKWLSGMVFKKHLCNPEGNLCNAYRELIALNGWN